MNMAEMKRNNKRRLSIDLSIFVPSDCIGSFFSAKSTTKSPKSFEEPNGVVGLGILAALKDLDQTHDPFLTAKSSRAALLAISPKSISTRAAASFNSDKFPGSRAKFCGGKGSGDLENMELSEEYTCVISHIGNNLIRKREYFDSDLVNKSESTTSYWVSSGAFSASSPGQDGDFPVFQTADFLSSCYLCKKKLHGLDIFMYRGEKAFCSAECRYKQISVDEHKEKLGSGVIQSLEYSVSTCSGPMQFLAGVAAA